MSAIELSSLVQVTHVGDDGASVRAATAERVGMAEAAVDATPFALIGTVAEIVDKLHGLREELGIHHFVVRDAEGFAPVVAALA